MVLEVAFIPMRNNVPCSQSCSSEVHINFDKPGGGWQTIPYECVSKWYFISQKPEQKKRWVFYHTHHSGRENYEWD